MSTTHVHNSSSNLIKAYTQTHPPTLVGIYNGNNVLLSPVSSSSFLKFAFARLSDTFITMHVTILTTAKLIINNIARTYRGAS
jgi:hypothetical protein